MINARQLTKLPHKPADYARFIPYRIAQKFKLPLLLTVLHIPLGILLYRSSSLALLHPVFVFLLGIYFALRKNERLERVAYVVAYLVGAEVLWRMAHSAIFWEFGKYAAATIMIVALLQRGHWKIPRLPMLYLFFLIPSCLLTLLTNSAEVGRNNISFNMSGPFLLFVSCWFFSYIKVNAAQLKKLLLTVVIPLVSVAVVTLFYSVTSEDIRFVNDSNAALSGGFGPNQVSSMLGLGVFICLTAYLLFRNSVKDTLYLSVLALLFAAQSVLTFSRGGIYNAIGATLVVLLFQMRNLSQGAKRLIPLLGIGLVFFMLIFPYLNNFTGGSLQTRFEDTESTGRMEIIEADFQTFIENPVLGVGVGESRAYREKILGTEYSSHTEFARIISEHGLFGILALFVLGGGVIYNLKREKMSLVRALTIGVVVWSSLFMTNAGTRLAAPSFMWGMSFLSILTLQMKRKTVQKVSEDKKLVRH